MTVFRQRSVYTQSLRAGTEVYKVKYAEEYVEPGGTEVQVTDLPRTGRTAFLYYRWPGEHVLVVIAVYSNG